MKTETLSSEPVTSNGVNTLLTAGLLITYCKDCDKPLYTKENIERFGFDPQKYCRSNQHLETVVKTCR